MTRQLIEGIIHITGETGSGKTAAALSAPVKSQKSIAVFNFDHKPYPGQEKEWGFYRAYLHMMSAEPPKGKTSEQVMVETVLEDMEKLPDGVEVVIFDAWEVFAKGLVSHVMRNATKYKHWIGGGQILQMSKLGHASMIEAALLDGLYTLLGVKSLFVINHLMHEYDGAEPGKSVRTGRRVPRSSARLQEKARLRLWVKPNPHPDYQCPIFVVLKDPGVHVWDQKNGGMRAARLFPDRLDPQALSKPFQNVSLWDIIEHYQSSPVANRQLEDYETATEEEFAMVAGTLTKAQKRVWERNQEIALAFGGGYTTGLGDRMAELKKENTPFPVAFKTLKDEGLIDDTMNVGDFKKVYDK
jgi:hypothetical protein